MEHQERTHFQQAKHDYTVGVLTIPYFYWIRNRSY